MSESEQKKPQAGEWWFYGETGNRWFCHGGNRDGIPIMEDEAGGVFTYRGVSHTKIHHEPRCTGWDWKSDPEPEWFDLTPFGEHRLRKEIDQYEKNHDDVWLPIRVYEGATIDGMKSIWGYDQRFRCLLKDAPPELVEKTSGLTKAKEIVESLPEGQRNVLVASAMASRESQPKTKQQWFDLTPFKDHVPRHMIDYYFDGEIWVECTDPINGEPPKTIKEIESFWGETSWRCRIQNAPPELLKPAEDPDEWVTQDRVEERKCDQRRLVHAVSGSCGRWDNGQLSNKRHGHEWASGYRLELRCLRRDLPPMPEPKPATQTFVFHECIVKQGCPPDYYTLEWVCDVPKHSNWIPTGRTETREVVR